MDSTKSRQLQEEERQATIRRQIAALQAQLKEPLGDDEDAGKVAKVARPVSPKRRKTDHVTLAPGTPSPSEYTSDILLSVLNNRLIRATQA